MNYSQTNKYGDNIINVTHNQATRTLTNEMKREIRTRLNFNKISGIAIHYQWSNEIKQLLDDLLVFLKQNFYGQISITSHMLSEMPAFLVEPPTKDTKDWAYIRMG